jgi:hypothetical protein
LQIWREARCHLSTTPEHPSTAPATVALPTSQCAHSCVPQRVRVKSTSLNRNFLILLDSPLVSARTGLRLSPPEKMLQSCVVACRRPLSLVRFASVNHGIAAILAISEQIEEFLCTSDCMAERVGFEPTLPFRVNTLSKRAPSATRPSLRREIRFRKLSRQRVSAPGRTNETRYFPLRFYGPDGRTASRRLSDHL